MPVSLPHLVLRNCKLINLWCFRVLPLWASCYWRLPIYLLRDLHTGFLKSIWFPGNQNSSATLKLQPEGTLICILLLRRALCTTNTETQRLNKKNFLSYKIIFFSKKPVEQIRGLLEACVQARIQRWESRGPRGGRRKWQPHWRRPHSPGSGTPVLSSAQVMSFWEAPGNPESGNQAWQRNLVQWVHSGFMEIHLVPSPFFCPQSGLEESG